ncbi:MAG TPA: MarR family winged helix-turn-helix transcriptional regulator [Xanthomonadales bacterium]|nr:MarR family winged helix-turn-helix transcriptional regulator [Xanthomonadales bacterium]
MTPTPHTGSSDVSGTDRQLVLLMAHAVSQPLRLNDHTEASLSVYAVFWSVAASEGRTQVEVAESTGLSSKTVSRVISHIGMARDGLGWIKQVLDEDDRRVRRLYLSSRGKTLLGRMLRDMKNIGKHRIRG